MTLRDWLGFLVGRRAAIIRCVTDRRAIWFGLVSVVIAAVGREYDAEYLLAEPYHLLIGPGASLLTALLLFSLLRSVSNAPIEPRRFRQFLAVFWLTGPLAWLYAIPFERWSDTETAALWNLWLLLVVSVWRVVLITRVSSVWFGVSFGRVLAPVLLICDVIALVALVTAELQVVAMMGGVRGGSESIAHAIGCWVIAIGLISLPLWISRTIWASTNARKGGSWPTPPDLMAKSAPSAVGWLLVVPAVAIAVVSYYGQQEQANGYEVARAIRQGRGATAFAPLLAGAPLPPHWRMPDIAARDHDATDALFTDLEGRADAEMDERAFFLLREWFRINGYWVLSDSGEEFNRAFRLMLRFPMLREHTAAFRRSLSSRHADYPSGIDWELMHAAIR